MRGRGRGAGALARPASERTSGGRGTGRRGILAAFLGLAVCAALPDGKAWAERFDALALPLEGEVKTVISHDLDGDGRREMVASLCVHEEDRTRRLLNVYKLPSGKGGDGAFKLASTWEAPPEAVFWCAGPATGQTGRESLYVLAYDGLWELCAGPAGTMVPAHRVEAPLFVSSGQEDELAWLDAMRDWNGDGAIDLFLPGAREARFYRQDGAKGWRLRDAVSIVPFAAYNNNVIFGRNAGGYQYLSLLFYPLMEPADLNGDGRMDLLVLQTGKAHRFFRGEDGKLDQNGVVWDLDIRTKEERIRKEATLTFRVADLNRDGCADIVVHKVGVRFTDWSSETAVFLGNREGPPRPEPFQRFTSGGLLSGVSIEDLDGDGFPDMALWSMKMGLWPFVDILLRKVVTIDSQYFYPSWPDGFPEKPAQKLTHEFRIDQKRQHFFRGIVPNTSGDYDGDGIRDLVAGRDLETIGIYLGVAKKGFEARPWAALKAEGVNYVSAGDLNGDGLCDLYGYSVQDPYRSSLHVWLQRAR